MTIRRLTDTGEWTTRRYLSLLGNVVIWIIVAIDAWYLWPTQLGGDTSIVVVSGSSMEPTYFGGDLVIARKTPPSVGDVIVYAPAGLGGSQIVHRIIGGSAAEGWRMQGDNNDFVDPFTPKAGEVKGVVLVHYANFGQVTVLLLNPMVWAFVLLAAMVLMLWYSGDDCDDDDEDDRSDDIDADPESEAEDESDLFDRVVEGADAAVSRMVSAGAGAGAAALAALTRGARSVRLPSSAPVRGFAILAAVGLIAISGLSPASASQLIMNVAGQASVMSYAKCDDLTLTVAASGIHTGINYSEVTVVGVTAGCSALPMTVYLHKSNGALIATGQGTTASPSTVVALARFHASEVDGVIVKIGGWIFPATWGASGGPLPAVACVPVNGGGQDPGGNGQSCAITGVTVATWESGGYQWADVSMTVSSSQADARVTLDLSQSPFPGWTPSSVNGNGDFVTATVPAPAYDCTQLPVVELNRSTSGSSWTLALQMTTQPDAFPAAGASLICQ